MDTCPACGTELGDAVTECPSCGLKTIEATDSFPPVTGGDEPAEVTLEQVESPVLIVRKGAEVGERFYIDRPKLTIGRDPRSDVFLNDVTVSRKHAVVEKVGDEVSISDVGSLNGTYVNGVSVDNAVLESGSFVQIGRFQMVYLAGGGE